ncbi:MAG: aerobic carbon-monoxide dehydrogenase medium subunit [Frankiaceae bacterium]|nr:aerobic carbon-monoxide dehydrogenase medium subunit [Frankiaceae bacterium]
MIPPEFDYVKAGSVDEAVAALTDHGEDAKVLAGGQSLIPLLRLRLAYPSVLVDVGGVAEMRGVRDDGDAIVIGSSTTHAEVIADPLVQQHAPLVAKATVTVADRQVRHRGTFGGSLSHADPAGDLPAVAVALDALLVVAGAGGSRREVSAADFFVDYLQTALAPDELVVEVRLPKLGDGWGFHYEKFHRVAQAWAIVGVAAAVKRDNGSIVEARIGLTNMGARPVRATAVEAALAGAGADETSVAAAAAHADEGTEPPSDLGGQADYRRHLARVLTRRAVLAAAGG